MQVLAFAASVSVDRFPVSDVRIRDARLDGFLDSECISVLAVH